MTDRVCVICGQTYTPHNGKQKTCSAQCSEKLRKKTQKEYYQRNKHRINERKKEYGKKYWRDNYDRLYQYHKDYRKRRQEELWDMYYEHLKE